MIIEKVSGMKYAEFMRQRVFAPFGMTSYQHPRPACDRKEPCCGIHVARWCIGA
jgi:CubicO group peptidase (beta-lactamase class C family)